MRDSTYKLTLDVHAIESQIQIVAKKNDSARKIIVTLMEDGKPYVIEKAARAVMMVKKPDGNKLYNDCNIIDSGSAISYDFTAQTTTSDGLCECEVRLYGNDGSLLTSPRFTMVVSNNVYDDGQIYSESEFNVLRQMITEVGNLDIESDDGSIVITRKDGTEEVALEATDEYIDVPTYQEFQELSDKMALITDVDATINRLNHTADAIVEGKYELLSNYASEIVDNSVDVIEAVASGSLTSIEAAASSSLTSFEASAQSISSSKLTAFETSANNYANQKFLNLSVEMDREASRVEGEFVEYIEGIIDDTGIANIVDSISGKEARLAVMGYSCPKLSTETFDYVDKNNVLHCRVGRVDLSSLNWHGPSTGANDSKVWTLDESHPLEDIKPVSNPMARIVCACSEYTGDTYPNVLMGDRNHTIAVNNAKVLAIVDNDVSTLSELITKLKGKYLYYELQTEKTYSVLNLNYNSFTNGQRASLQVRGFSCPKLSDTVYDYVDSNNVLHCKVGRVDLGALDWIKNGNQGLFSHDGKIGVKVPNESVAMLATSTKYEAKSNDVVYNRREIGISVNGDGFLRIYDSNYASVSASDFKASLNGVYLYYELATEQTYSVLDNNALDTVGTVTNMLNPTIQSQAVNGLTINRNSDNTYTINGTATNDTGLVLSHIKSTSPIKILGCPSGGSGDKFFLAFMGKAYDFGNGEIVGNIDADLVMVIARGYTCNNLTFKPMITSSLSATINDYVPFTGTTGKLNSDVAEIQKSMGWETATITESDTTNHFYTVSNTNGRLPIAVVPLETNVNCRVYYTGDSNNKFRLRFFLFNNEYTAIRVSNTQVYIRY